MTELEYRYIKGMGWVPALLDFREFTFQNGVRGRLEARVPNVGECYRCGWGDRWILAPKVPNLDAWLESVSNYSSIYSVSQLTERDYNVYEQIGNGNTGWVTLVLL